MYETEWDVRAVRQLARLEPARDRAAILAAVSKLRQFPQVAGVGALASHRYEFRLRVGRYRVLFDVLRDERVVAIREVTRRNERTY